MADKKEKNKGKKSAMAIITAILVPILIVVLIAGSFIAIIAAIIQIIVDIIIDIINAIISFLKNPIATTQKAWAKVTNFIKSKVIKENTTFNENEYEALKIDPSVVISLTEFESMKTRLSSAINMRAAGLDDIMMKKMLISYYRANFLYDTNILIQITEGEKEELENDTFTGSIGNKAFSVIKGNKDEGLGEDGNIYLKSKGMVHIYKGSEKIVYHSTEVLREIYQKHYLDVVDKNEDYADSVLEYLEKCYTYGNGGIMMYSTVKDKTMTQLKYENIDEVITKTDSKKEARELTNINFYDKISEYSTPMEFIVDLMEITGSKDFINAFLETAHKETRIEMKLKSITNKVNEKTVTEKTRYNVVTGKKAENSVIRTDGTSDEQEITKTKEDTSKITETVTKEHEEEKYDVFLTKAVTWHSIIEQNIDEITSKTYYTQTADKKEKEIIDANSYEIVKKEDEYNEYNEDTNSKIFDERVSNTYFSDIPMGFTITEYALNRQYNYIITKEEEGYNSEDYIFNKMTSTDTEIKTYTVKTTSSTIYNSGTKTVKDNTNLFLGLLSNDKGEYILGSNFKAKLNGGKVVRYPDLYKGSTGAGDLLENGAEMLFALLEESPNTQGLTDIMRYIMYLYSGKQVDYGVTELIFFEYDLETMSKAMGISGFWWPIGSSTTETIDGKMFAKDAPVATKITSGFGPRWGENHGAIDISGRYSMPGPNIIASDSGTVKFATKSGGIYDTGYYGCSDGGGYGNYVIIDHGNGYETYYAHLYKGTILVKTGDTVEKGQVIGKMGSSGSSTGIHLHYEVRLNGVKLDPEEHVSSNNPRPDGIGGISEGLYNFILAFEGGKSYFNQADKTYTVFNNGLDKNLELTCGVAIGTIDGGVFDYVKNILGRTVTLGSKITVEEYNKILEKVIQDKMNVLDKAIAKTGVTLTQQQKDAAYSLCWNASNSSTTMKEALTNFKNSGEEGYWKYIHDYTNNGVDGLVRRRAEEFELFLDGDYSVGSINHGLNKHKEYNTKYGFPENEGG